MNFNEKEDMNKKDFEEFFSFIGILQEGLPSKSYHNLIFDLFGFKEPTVKINVERGVGKENYWKLSRKAKLIDIFERESEIRGYYDSRELRRLLDQIDDEYELDGYYYTRINKSDRITKDYLDERREKRYFFRK